MASDNTRARRQLRMEATRLGISVIDVMFCSKAYMDAVKRENQKDITHD